MPLGFSGYFGNISGAIGIATTIYSVIRGETSAATEVSNAQLAAQLDDIEEQIGQLADTLEEDRIGRFIDLIAPSRTAALDLNSVAGDPFASAEEILDNSTQGFDAVLAAAEQLVQDVESPSSPIVLRAIAGVAFAASTHQLAVRQVDFNRFALERNRDLFERASEFFEDAAQKLFALESVSFDISSPGFTSISGTADDNGEIEITATSDIPGLEETTYTYPYENTFESFDGLLQGVARVPSFISNRQYIVDSSLATSLSTAEEVKDGRSDLRDEVVTRFRDEIAASLAEGVLEADGTVDPDDPGFGKDGEKLLELARLYGELASGNVPGRGDTGFATTQSDVLDGRRPESFADEDIFPDYLHGEPFDAVADGGAGDLLRGGGGADALEGLFGPDTLLGGAGPDAMHGDLSVASVALDDLSALKARFDPADEDDVLIGGPGDDTLIGGLGTDTLQGGEGTDIAFYSGADYPGLPFGISEFTIADQGRTSGGNYLAEVTGPDGQTEILSDVERLDIDDVNIVFGDDTGEEIVGTINGTAPGAAGIDLLIGRGGDDRLFAAPPGATMTDQNDTLRGGPGDDTLQGAQGDDELAGGPGEDVLGGGAGTDTARFSGRQAEYGLTKVTTVADSLLFVTRDNATDAFLRGIERLAFADASFDLIAGGFFSDETLAGGVGAEWIAGGVGADALSGAGGNDALFGGDGTDALSGGAGDDTLVGSFGDDALDGGPGIDVARYSGDASDYTLTPGEPTATVAGPEGTDTLTGVELVRFDDITFESATGNGFFGDGDSTLEGSPFDDAFVGGLGDDILEGFAGDDALGGDEDDDTLLGGSGDDTLTGGAGEDSIDGGTGDDSAVFAGTRTDSTVAEGFYTTVVTGPDGADTLENVERLVFEDVTREVARGAPRADEFDDTVEGGPGGGLIVGTAADEFFDPGGGDDEIAAGEGRDGLVGGRGDDRLEGGPGDDTLEGGAGFNTLLGGAGDDFAYYTDLAPEDVEPSLDGDTVVLRGPGFTDRLEGIEQLAFAGIDLQVVALTEGDDEYPVPAEPHFPLILGGPGDDEIEPDVDEFQYDSAFVVEGGPGNDEIQGLNPLISTVGDTLDGGPGDDRLAGRGGGDTYRFRDGFGNDTLSGIAIDGEGEVERLVFDADTVVQVSERLSGDQPSGDMLIEVVGRDDSVILRDLYEDGFEDDIEIVAGRVPDFAEPEVVDGVVRLGAGSNTGAVGAGATYLGLGGEHRFLVSDAARPGTTAVVADTGGGTIQLPAGLGIVGALVLEDAVQLDLFNGARVQILLTDRFDFDVGGNATTGTEGALLDYDSFAETVLDTVPVAGEVLEAGPTVIQDDDVVPVIPEPPDPVLRPVDGVIRGVNAAETLLVARGRIYLGQDGADTLLVSEATAAYETSVVDGGAGANTVQLSPGLGIAGSRVVPNAIELTLDNGAVVQILEAGALGYEVAANATTGTAGSLQGFEEFVTSTLGTSVPESGVATGGPVNIAVSEEVPAFSAEAIEDGFQLFA